MTDTRTVFFKITRRNQGLVITTKEPHEIVIKGFLENIETKRREVALNHNLPLSSIRWIKRR